MPVKDAEFTGEESTNGLLTGDFEVTLKPAWKSQGRLILRQINPLPMRVLAVVPDVYTEE